MTKKKAVKRKPAAKKKAAKKKPGPQKGAKHPDRKVATLTPSPCPHCRKILKPVDQRNRRRIVASGITPAGQAYGAVVLHSANCSSCRGAVTTRQYESVA